MKLKPPALEEEKVKMQEFELKQHRARKTDSD